MASPTQSCWLILVILVIAVFSYQLGWSENFSTDSVDEKETIIISNDASTLDLFKYCSTSKKHVHVQLGVKTDCKGDNCDNFISFECLSATEFVAKLMKKEMTDFNPDECTRLRDLQKNVCHEQNFTLAEKPKPSPIEVWGFGMLSVTVICLCSLMGVTVLPFAKRRFYNHLLNCLVGLAAGSLLSSSLFHLMPQAYGLTDTDSNQNHLNQSVIIAGGIWVFLMAERILKIIAYCRQSKLAVHSCDKKECVEDVSNTSNQTGTVQPLHPQQEIPQNQEELVNERGICTTTVEVYDYQFCQQERPHTIHSTGHNHGMAFENKHQGETDTVAWMIIIGDSMHNLIDGLSMGAAFHNSVLGGLSISLGVICEEFPHELGDFAVLLNAGMKKKRAAYFNFLSSTTCYLGLTIGIFVGEVQSKAIFAFASGMFIYVSLVGMVKEMNSVLEEASKISVKKGCQTLLLQNIGMGIGCVALYMLARYQNSINFDET